LFKLILFRSIVPSIDLPKGMPSTSQSHPTHVPLHNPSFSGNSSGKHLTCHNCSSKSHGSDHANPSTGTSLTLCSFQSQSHCTAPRTPPPPPGLAPPLKNAFMNSDHCDHCDHSRKQGEGESKAKWGRRYFDGPQEGHFPLCCKAWS